MDIAVPRLSGYIVQNSLDWPHTVVEDMPSIKTVDYCGYRCYRSCNRIDEDIDVDVHTPYGKRKLPLGA